MSRNPSYRMKRARNVAAATLVLSGCLPVAFAQDPGSTGSSSALETVIVTATKRAENLQEVPVAVSAVTASELESRSITETSDLMGAMPNLQVTSAYGRTQPNFSLRGISVANEFSAATASPVGVYVDEVYQSFRASHGQQLYDLEQVEVVRGPQGTLFGRNTTGGAVSFTTKKPQLDGTDAYASFGAGRFDAIETAAAVEITPIQDQLGFRLAGTYSRADGYTLSNQQTTIENITIAGQATGGEIPVIVGKRATLVAADIVDLTSPQQIEYSVRPQGAPAFVSAATLMPNDGATVLQSSASIDLNRPQIVDGDATLRVTVTNAFGLVFSRDVPFIIDSQSPVVTRLLGSRFFDRVSGTPCSPRQPLDTTDSCMLYLGSGTIDVEARDNRAIDSVTLTVDGGATPVAGVQVVPEAFSFNLPNLPDAERIVTITAVDRAQNASVVRQSVAFDTAPPTITRFELDNDVTMDGFAPLQGLVQADGGGVSVQVEDAGGIDSAAITLDGVPSNLASIAFNADRTRATLRLNNVFDAVVARFFPRPDDADSQFVSLVPFTLAASVTDRAGNTTTVPGVVLRFPSRIRDELQPSMLAEGGR